MATTVTTSAEEGPSPPSYAAEVLPIPPLAAETPSATDPPEEEEEEEEEDPPEEDEEEDPPEEDEEDPPEEDEEGDPEELPNSSLNTSPPPPQQSETPISPSPPPFLDSIAKLRGLSSSLAEFYRCYDDLHSHIDSINSAILSKLPPQTLDTPTVQIAHQPLPILKSTTPVASSAAELTPVAPEEKKIEADKDSLSELEGLCRAMCSRGMRRYISAHLSDREKLREEVPKALKYAVNVPKLVFDCLGKFYLQGTKAFAKNSPMISSRDASIFMLECFLLSMGMDGVVIDVEKSVKGSADDAAMNWKKRLVAEGGLAKANLVDARGLLFLIACFGVPNSFKREDVRDLVVAANAKEIVDLLKKSQLLMDNISDVIEGMMKNKMKVDAVDFAYTFGLEEKFDPQIILISYLQESKEAPKKPKKGSQGSPAALNEANKKQLAALKSVSNCLLRHKIDPAKLLPGWQIEVSISTLEKEIAEFAKNSEEKSLQKRKANEPESSNKSKGKEAKRSRYTKQGPSHHQGSSHDRRNVLPNHDSRRNVLPNHAVNYSASSSVIYGGPGAGLLPESMISPGVVLGQSVSRAGTLSTNPYAGGFNGGIVSDSAGQVLGRSQPYMYDAALIEKYAAQPPSVGLMSLYRAPASSAGVTNSPSVGPGSRTPGSDLYQFADSVVEREPYTVNGPRGVGGIPTTVPGHRSYMYHQV